MIRKTYDHKLDTLIEKLNNSWDGGPSAGYAYVVDADVAHDAALMLIEMFEKLERYETAHYND